MANVVLSLNESTKNITVLLDQRDQMTFSLDNAQLVYTGLRWETEPTVSGFVKYNPESKKYSSVPADEVIDEESDNVATSKAIANYVKANGGKIQSISVDGVEQEIDDNKNVNLVLTDYAKTAEVEEYIENVESELKNNINTVESIAKGANQAVSYGNYSTMITAFNSLAKDVYNVGQNIMIVSLDVPDLWVAYVEDSNISYTYTNDETFVNELNTNGFVQVGYYKLGALETQKVDLANYIKNTDYATRDTAGVVKVAIGTGIFLDENKRLAIDSATNEEIKNKQSYTKPLVPARIDLVVKEGVTNNTIELTDEEKKSAHNWLGSMSKDAITLTLKDNGAYTLTINKE